MHAGVHTCTSQLLDEEGTVTASLALSVPIMVAKLVGNHPCVPGLILAAIVLILNRQGAQRSKKAALGGNIDLQSWRGLLRVVQRADGNLDAAIKFVAQWRAALGAEATSVALGTGEIGRSFTCPDHAIRFDQWTKKAAKCFLAHAAMAQRREAKAFNAVTNGAALAAALGCGF